MKHPFVLLALLAGFAIAVLASTPARAAAPTIVAMNPEPAAPSQGCCGPVPSPGGVFDRGPRPHAMGYVSGSYYCVAFGDTLFSISQRFGVSAQQIAAANGIPNPWLIFANQYILIPGLGITPIITPTVTPPPTPSIAIVSPAPNAVLPATFQVNGTATGPNGATIAVQAQNNSSNVLAGTTTTLQTSNGAFGSGNWSVNLTVNTATSGRIVAALVGQPIGPAVAQVTFNGGSIQQLTITQPPQNSQLPTTFAVNGTAANLPGNQVTVQAQNLNGGVIQTQQVAVQNIQPNGQGTWQATFSNVNGSIPTTGRIAALAAPGSTVAPAIVNVTFNATPSCTTNIPAQCRVNSVAGLPYYQFPGGPVSGNFAQSGQSYTVVQICQQSGQNWYQFNGIQVGGNNVWVPSSGGQLITGCN